MTRNIMGGLLVRPSGMRRWSCQEMTLFLLLLPTGMSRITICRVEEDEEGDGEHTDFE